MTTKNLKPGDKLRCPDGKARTISSCVTLGGKTYIVFEDEPVPQIKNPGWQMCPDIKWLLEDLK